MVGRAAQPLRSVLSAALHAQAHIGTQAAGPGAHSQTGSPCAAVLCRSNYSHGRTTLLAIQVDAAVSGVAGPIESWVCCCFVVWWGRSVWVRATA